VFSLGALLYRILSGQPPYLADAVEDLLRLAEQAAIPYPQTLRPELSMPQRLCDIAMQALAADPDDRYATVDALVSEVQAFLHGDGRFHQEQFEAGALVIREGDSGDAAYVVGEGRCVAFKMVDGVRRNLREMGPGDVFGETAILTEGRRTASVEALEPLVVTVVTRQSLEQEIGQCHWMGRVVRSLAERFRDVDERHTLVRTMLDESKLTLEIMRYLALNATGTKKRRAAPWTPLATALTRRFGRPRAELAEHVRRTGLVEIDLAQDEIVLVDTRA
jgi:CRP-like cAMP-binding protein